MTVGSAIRQGFTVTRRAGTGVWALFLANLALAALAALPIYRGILGFTGHSLMTQELLRGFSTDWFTDFTFKRPGVWDHYALIIANVGLVAILVNAILAGGVLARFRDPGLPQGPFAFFRDVSRYAWRMVRLMIIGLICYWLVFLALNQGLTRLTRRWTENALDDRPVFWINLVVGLVTVVGLIFVNLVMDYARVNLVRKDETSAVAAFLSSLGFSLRRLWKALTVYAVPSLLGIGLLVVYRLVVPWGFVNQSLGSVAWSHLREPLVLALLFIGQQVIMWGRYWFRVATWASEWSYSASAR
jgi:hypothetical protein